MGLYEQFAKRIASKQREIAEMQARIREAEVAIRTWEEAQRLVPKEPNGVAVRLRPGTDLAKAEAAIRAAGSPLRINDIVIAIGKEDTKANRVALAGSISAYVRKESVFARPEPNTFGLIELGHHVRAAVEGEEEPIE